MRLISAEFLLGKTIAEDRTRSFDFSQDITVAAQRGNRTLLPIRRLLVGGPARKRERHATVTQLYGTRTAAQAHILSTTRAQKSASTGRGNSGHTPQEHFHFTAGVPAKREMRRSQKPAFTALEWSYAMSLTRDLCKLRAGENVWRCIY